MTKLEAAKIAHEKRLRQLGVPEDIIRGRRKKARQKLVLPKVVSEREIAPTSDRIPGNGAAKERSIYTGDEIMGIGVMHKSNLVPVTRSSDGAKDLARMRRGE